MNDDPDEELELRPTTENRLRGSLDMQDATLGQRADLRCTTSDHEHRWVQPAYRFCEVCLLPEPRPQSGTIGATASPRALVHPARRPSRPHLT